MMTKTSPMMRCLSLGLALFACLRIDQVSGECGKNKYHVVEYARTLRNLLDNEYLSVNEVENLLKETPCKKETRMYGELDTPTVKDILAVNNVGKYDCYYSKYVELAKLVEAVDDNYGLTKYAKFYRLKLATACSDNDEELGKQLIKRVKKSIKYHDKLLDKLYSSSIEVSEVDALLQASDFKKDIMIGEISVSELLALKEYAKSDCLADKMVKRNEIADIKSLDRKRGAHKFAQFYLKQFTAFCSANDANFASSLFKSIEEDDRKTIWDYIELIGLTDKRFNAHQIMSLIQDKFCTPKRNWKYVKRGAIEFSCERILSHLSTIRTFDRSSSSNDNNDNDNETEQQGAGRIGELLNEWDMIENTCKGFAQFWIELKKFDFFTNDFEVFYCNHNVNSKWNYSLNHIFADAWKEREYDPLPVTVKSPKTSQVYNAAKILEKSSRPLLVIGSQAVLRPYGPDLIADNVKRLGIPVYLNGAARGLMGADYSLQFRHARKDAVREADCVILLGAACDFRLSYGQIFKRPTKIISVNRAMSTAKLNAGIFWQPTLAIESDVGKFVQDLVAVMSKSSGKDSDLVGVDQVWLEQLKQRDDNKDSSIEQMLIVM